MMTLHDEAPGWGWWDWTIAAIVAGTVIFCVVGLIAVVWQASNNAAAERQWRAEHCRVTGYTTGGGFMSSPETHYTCEP